jgi:hypothetical protein
VKPARFINKGTGYYLQAKVSINSSQFLSCGGKVNVLYLEYGERHVNMKDKQKGSHEIWPKREKG